jgi:hypothetical protein
MSAALRRIFAPPDNRADAADRELRAREAAAEAALEASLADAQKKRASWDKRPAGTSTIRRKITEADLEIRSLLDE